MKKVQVFFLTALIAILAVACSFQTNMSYTFAVETGDNVKVTLDTTDQYSLLQENGTFTVKNGEDTILQGFFVTEEMYNQYLDVVAASGATVLEEDKKDENPYLYYEFEGEAGTENNFIVWVNNSKTGMVIASLSGQEKAKEAFLRLTFGLDK